VTATLGGVSVTSEASGDIDAIVIAASAAVAVGQTGVGASIGVAVSRNLIGYQQGTVAYSNTTGDSVTQLTQNSTTVLIEQGARKGDVYRYIGDTVTEADNVIDEDDNTAPYALNSQDYGNTDLWELVNLDEAAAVVDAAIVSSDVTADGGVTVDALSTQAIRAASLAGAVAVAGGQVGVAVSGSGSAVENRINSDVSARIAGAATDLQADHVVVNADDISSIDAVSAAMAISAAFGQTGVAVSIGISVAINNIANDVTATIADGAVSTSGAQGIIISASTPELPIDAPVADVVIPVSVSDLDDLAVAEMDGEDTRDGVDFAADAILAEDIADALRGQGFDIVGTVKVAALEEGERWTAIDEEGRSVALSLVNGQILASKAGINAVSGAAALSVAAGQIGVGIAGAGAVALNAIQTNVAASTSGADLTTTGSGDVVIDARSDVEINAAVLAVSAAVAAGQVGVGVGIGVSVARNFIGRDLTGNTVADTGAVSAFASDTTMDLSGDLTIHAESAQSIRALTFAGAAAVAAGQVGVGVAGSGAYAENVIDATTEAYIDGDGTGISASAVSVSAEDASTIDAYGGSVAVAAGFGMVGVAVSAGIGIGFNAIGSDVLAEIRNTDDGVESTAGAVTIEAMNTAAITAGTAAAALAVSGGLVGVSFAGAGAYAENEITGATAARITDATVDAQTDVLVSAESDATIDAIVLSAAAAIGVGAGGFGASIGVSLAENRIGNGDGSGVFAAIDGSTVTAGGDVDVLAKMDDATIDATVVALSVAIAGGAVAGAAAGSGSDALNEIDYAVIAEIDNSGVTASGNTVTVDAQDNSVIDSFVGAASVAGSAGLVGGSVSIAVGLSENSVDNTIRAQVDNSDVTAADLAVNAEDDSDTYAAAAAAAVSASISLGFSVAGAGTEVRGRNSSTTEALVSGSGTDDVITLSGDMSVTAEARPRVEAETVTASLSLGFAAFGAAGSFVDLDVTPEVTASVTGVQVDATDVAIGATSRAMADGFAVGVSLASGFAASANFVDVLVASDVTATGGGTMTVDTLSVEARTDEFNNNSNAIAEAHAAAGGLIGATSTLAETRVEDNVTAQIGANADITALIVVDVAAIADSSQYADANSAAFGLVGIGASIANADADVSSTARVGNNADISAALVNVSADGEAEATADTRAGSGGAVAGAGAAPTATIDADVLAQINDGAEIEVATNNASILAYYADQIDEVPGGLNVTAAFTSRPNALVKTDSYGLIAGSGAEANTDVTADVVVRFGTADDDSTGANVTAESIFAAATNTVVKDGVSGNHLDGDAGGLASGALSSSQIDIALTTQVVVDDHSQITTTDAYGSFTAKAFNALDIEDDVALFTAGALSGAGAYIDLHADTLLAEIVVGDDAVIDAAGQLILEANGLHDIDLHSKSETYGLGTVALGHAKIDLAPDNLITIGGTVTAGRDAYLTTGTDMDRRIYDHSLKARVDNFAGSLIPIDDLETRAVVITDNTITVESGALLEGYANINLFSDELGIANLDVKAKGVNWASAVGDAIDSALGGNNANLGPGFGAAVARGSVVNDGTIRTGAQRNKDLTITFDANTNSFIGTSTTSAGVQTWTFDPGSITGPDSTGSFDLTTNGQESDIPFTVKLEQVETTRSAQLDIARENLALYNVTDADGELVNEDLVQFYQDQIERILEEMLAFGEANWFDNNNNGVIDIDQDELVALQPTVQVIEVDPVFAQAGLVEIITDQLYGSGTFDTPRDASINITNQTAAYLVINGAEIPEVNGGVYFNSVDVSMLGDPGAAILAENAEVLEDDGGYWTTIAPNFGFTAASTTPSGGVPEINITIDYDALGAVLNDGDPNTNTAVWPDLFIEGPVLNLRGDITLDNNSGYGSSTGSVIINAEVNGLEVRTLSNGTTILDTGATQDHLAGEPYAKWKTSDLTGDDYVNRTAGMENAEEVDQTAIDDFLAVTPTEASITGDRIYIESQYLNINGIIQSGEEDFHVTLDDTTRAKIDEHRQSGSSTTILLPTTNPDFQIYFDPTANAGLGAVLVTPLRPGGGYVDITARVMNTRNGEIIVYGGYPEIEITNSMVFAGGYTPEIIVQELDATTRGTGELIIKDLAKPDTNGVPYTTIYKVNDDGVVEISDNGGGFVGQGSDKEFTYTPEAGYRYGWMLAQGTREVLVEEWTEGDWLGIDAFAPDSRAPDRTDSTKTEGELVPDSNYFYLDTAKDGDAYTYDSVEVVGNVNGPNRTGYDHWSTWYGTNYSWFQYTTVTDSVEYVTHTIEADRPVGITFIGHDAGSIVVNAGASDITVDGPLRNAYGHTQLNTTGVITTNTGGAISGEIGGRTIGLSARAIGSAFEDVHVNLSDIEGVTGQRIDATASDGIVSLYETVGDLTLGMISAANGGYDAVITSAGSILAASSNHGIIGDAIDLIAEDSDIGASARAIQIDTGTRDQSLLTATALQGAVYVVETDGDLRLFKIQAQGDVYLGVLSGDLLDGNQIEETDERAVSELRDGVWGALKLTDYETDENGVEVYTGNATDKLNEVKDTLANAKTSEYQQYWQTRLAQVEEYRLDLAEANPGWDDATLDAAAADFYLTFRPGSSEYDAAQLLLLTEDEEAYYEEFYTAQAISEGAGDVAAYVANAILTLRTSRTEQYRNLDAVWGSYTGGTSNPLDPDVYDETWEYELTTEENELIESSIKIWTEDELINAIGAGLLVPVTDTDTVIEDPNIVGANVELDVSGQIGATEGFESIAIDPDTELTPDERVLLSAAERDDLFFLTTDRFGATVDFDASANTITRSSGTWDSDLVGQVIQVEGNSANATEEGPFYTVEAITNGGTTLQLDTSRVLLTSSETNVAVHVSGLALDPRGVDLQDMTVDISGNTITLLSGNGDFSDYRAGMKLILAGDTENANDYETLYEITAATATTITVDGPALTTETGVTLDVNEYVELSMVQVQLREDLDIVVTGQLDVTAGGESYVGSESAIELGSLNVDGNLRVRAQGELSNGGNSASTNITSDNLVLESGDGGIGSDGMVYVDQTVGATLTARGTGDINITERTGDMNINTVYSAGGDVTLVADGSILDHNNTEFVNIEADSITLTAQTGSIGVVGNALEVEARGDLGDDLGLLTLTAEGDVIVYEQEGDMNIRNVLSRSGDVELYAQLSIFDAVDLVDPTSPETSADGNDTGSRLAADVLAAGNITLTADLGYIGAFGNELDIDSRRSGSDGVVTVTSRENTFLIEQAGDMWLNTVEVTQSNPLLATAYLTAVVGSIYNGVQPPNTSNVLGGRAYLIAQGDIGTSDNWIYTEIGALQSLSTTGSTYVDNQGALTLLTIDGGAGYGQQSGGDIYTVASSPITIENDILAAGDIIETATESAPDNYDNFTVNAGVEVRSTGGDIVFTAGDDMHVQTGASLIAETGSITLNADLAGWEAVGADILIDGALDGLGTVALNTGAWDDAVTVSATGSVLAGDLSVSTGFGEDAVTIDGTTGASGNSAISTGAGDDSVTVTGTMTTALATTIDTGAGIDLLDISGAVLSGSTLTVTTAEGEDRLDISGLLSAGTTLTVDTGETRDFLDISGDFVSGGNIAIALGGGDDQMVLTGGFTAATEILVEGGAGADSIRFLDATTMTGHATVLAGAGDDLVEIVRLVSQNRATDSFWIDGGDGSDDILLQTHGSVDGEPVDYIIDVFDTGGPLDADSMVVIGTEKDDVFLSRSTFFAVLHGDIDQMRGDDPTRPDTVERINYDRAINGRVTLLGEAGDDTFIADDNAAIMTLDGGLGDDSFQFGQLFGNDPNSPSTENGIAPGDEINAVLTTRGWLSDGISFATVAFGGEGQDSFTVYANRAQLKLEGESGNDEFTVRAFLLDSDGSSSLQDDTELNAGSGDDLIRYNINAPLDIDGGAGFDKVVVLGTEADDAFVITEDGVFGAGLNVSLSNTEELLEVDGLEGDDSFFILSTSASSVTRVIGGLGSDTFDVTGDVTEQIVSADLAGRSGLINHQANSADDDYDQTFIEGLGTTVADGNQGAIVISQEVAGDATPGETLVSEAEGSRTDVYSIRLTDVPTGVVYVTVSATRASSADRNLAVPAVADGTALSFAQGGSTITRDSGSFLDDGFDIYQSIRLSGTTDGDADGVYKIVSVTATEIVVEETFAIAANGDTSITLTGQEADSVLISADGTSFSDAIVLAFDAGNWDQAQTVTIEAQDDAAAEGSRDVVISHSVQSVDPAFDAAQVQNLVVEVRDNDLAELQITETGSETLVLEGAQGITDSYALKLSRAPAAGETVTITLSDNSNSGDLSFSQTVFSFDASNWDIAQSVTVTANANDGVENAERIIVTHTVSSDGPTYASAGAQDLTLTAIDGDDAGVLIQETQGDTVVIDSADDAYDETDSYTVRLTKAPTADVTISIFDDGQTRIVPGGRVSLATLADETLAVSFVEVADGADYIERSDGQSWADSGFGSGQTLDISGSGANDGAVLIGAVSADGTRLYVSGGKSLTDESGSASFTVTAAQITFTTANWFDEVAVTLEADPDYVPSETDYVTKVFPAEEHTASKVYGPLIIEGAPTEDRTLLAPVMLPTESVPGPIELEIVTDETEQNDRVNIFNDTDVTGAAGYMTTTTLPDGTERLLVNGLGMGTGTVDFDESIAQDGSEIVSYAQGITMNNVEIVDVLLGAADDDFTVLATNTFSDNTVDLPITAIHGGGGSDEITVLGGGGPESLLVIYGDTDTYGARYDYLGGAPTGGGLVFDGWEFPENHGDLIDASAIGTAGQLGLIIYGGIGKDTIIGSLGDDHIAGGGGDDDITALSGADHVYGDTGFTVDLLLRELVVSDDIVTTPAFDSADTRVPGDDSIDAGAGDDIVIADLGVIEQVAGTQRIVTTGAVIRVTTTRDGFGGDDEILAGLGNDIVMGGAGGDSVTDTGGANIVLGDNGTVDMMVLDGDESDVDHIFTESPEVAGNDTITTAAGTDVILAGTGDDDVDAGDGENIVFGDLGEVVAAAALDAPQLAGLAMTIAAIRSQTTLSGGSDTLITGAGGDVVLGGLGNDGIDAGQGANLVFGDNGELLTGTGAANLGALPLELLSAVTLTEANGGDDTVTTGLGEDIVLGGAGGDTITTDMTDGTGGTDGADIVLGDVGRVNWVNAEDGSTDLAQEIETTDWRHGGDDVISSGASNDLVIGGTGRDRILAGAGNDLVMGDHARIAGDIDETALPLTLGVMPFDVRATFTGGDRMGGNDTVFAGAGQDLVMGQQGDDWLFGEAGDDDLIGGHNVDTDNEGALAHDGDDAIDGGADDDVILGDNGLIYRTGEDIEARMRALDGTLLYGIGGADDAQAMVTGTHMANPDGTQQRAIELFDHSDVEDPVEYGDDYIAGGAENDVIFGQLGNDVIQGDGAIDLDSDGLADPGAVGASRDTLLTTLPSVDDFAGEGRDGDDYIEGNGGEDVIFGNLGQDDIIGGSSTLFAGLAGDESLRPDGADLLFGGSGTAAGRNDLGNEGIDGHARDADVILGDNGNIYRVVGTNGSDSGAYLGFAYDNYGGEKIVVRAVDLIDYTEGGPDYDAAALTDNGAGDEIHGEAGDDSIYGQMGSDALFGDGQNDDLIGGWGSDWISGGTGNDGVIGDDGRIMTSRNSTSYGEGLYGIAALASTDDLITGPNSFNFRYTINVDQQLKKSVNLTPFNLDPAATQDKEFTPAHADDVIFGGWGDDSLHGGAGDDAISGAEALPLSETPQAMDGTIVSWDTPVNPGGLLAYDPTVEEFAHYDENNPRAKITPNGGTFFLNHDASEGPVDPRSSSGVTTDGDDVIFGDLGNDAITGGTGRDRMYGGYGDDWLNADDVLETAGGSNDGTDTDESYEDYALGGAGRDVLIANTGGDRLHDWTGEYNSFIVPFRPFGAPTVNRLMAPAAIEFWYLLGESDGADPTRALDTGSDPARFGEPEGEMGIVTQQDTDWSDTHGAPADPQPGNGPAQRDVRVTAANGAGNDARSETADYGGNGTPAAASAAASETGSSSGGASMPQEPTEPGNAAPQDPAPEGEGPAARASLSQIQAAIASSEIQLKFHPKKADKNVGKGSYSYDPELGEFVKDVGQKADVGAPTDSAYTLLDEDGALFAYIDSKGGLWVIDDLLENDDGLADDDEDDWVFVSDYNSAY